MSFTCTTATKYYRTAIDEQEQNKQDNQKQKGDLLSPISYQYHDSVKPRQLYDKEK